MESIRPMHEALKARAAELGLPMEPPKSLYNSRRALLLAEYARDEGKMEPVHWRLFEVNFVEGRNLANIDVLRDVATSEGLDSIAAIAALDKPEYAKRIDQSMIRALAYGISGVPTFIIDDRYKIIGAQPYDYLLAAVRQVQQEHSAGA
jgi:predicted DsbA family dithiol-disulfide isomerase